MSGERSPALGRPRVHLRATDSTNDRARALAAGGAPHGTIVTAGYQSAGRGRQGRSWTAPPGRALLLSLVLRRFDPLLPLRAGLAVADLAAAHGHRPAVKWPNDVLAGGRKIAGVLVEARPSDGWAVLGIGVNVAVRADDFPPELRATAGTLAAEPASLEPALARLLAVLDARLTQPVAAALSDMRAADALLDRPLRWADGSGTGAGIDDSGALRVRLPDGTVTTLEAGEVHLQG